MKRNKLVGAVLLLFFTVLMLSIVTGCKKQDIHSNNDASITEKWDALINNETADIAGVEISTYTVLPITSSTAPIVQLITVDNAEKIDSLISIIANKDVDFEDYPSDLEGLGSYQAARVGKQAIKIVLKDSGGREVLGLCVYSDDTADVLEPMVIIEETESLAYTYHAHFTDKLYGSLLAIFEDEKDRFAEAKMVLKWEELLNNAVTNVASVTLSAYDIYYLTVTYDNVVINDKATLQSLLAILRDNTVEFETYPTDFSGEIYYFYQNSVREAKALRLIFKDSDGRNLFGLRVFNDDKADLLEPASGGRTNDLAYTFHAMFSNKLYDKLLPFYENGKSTDESPAIYQELLTQLARDFGKSDGTVSFTVKTFSQDTLLASVVSDKIKIANGKLYINSLEVLSVRNIENPLTEYAFNIEKLFDIGEIRDGVKSETELLDVLEKMKHSKQCYLLKTSSSTEGTFHYCAIYKIDGVYYFLTTDTTGPVPRIHYSIP